MGSRTSSPCQPEPVARLAVGDVGNGAGIGDINVGFRTRIYDLKSRLAELIG